MEDGVYGRGGPDATMRVRERVLACVPGGDEVACNFHHPVDKFSAVVAVPAFRRAFLVEGVDEEFRNGVGVLTEENATPFVLSEVVDN